TMLCRAPVTLLAADSTTWLNLQHASEATRLRLLSSRRNAAIPLAHTSVSHASLAPQSPVRNVVLAAVQHRASSIRRAPRPQTPDNPLQQPNSDSPAQPLQLVDALGALGWRCKGAPSSQWPHDALTSLQTLATALIPHVAALSPSDLAHCCWAIAQFSDVAGKDVAVLGFLSAVQQELLEPAFDAKAAAAAAEATAPTAEATSQRRRCATRLASIPAKDLSKLAWALAKLGVGPESGRGTQGEAQSTGSKGLQTPPVDRVPPLDTKTETGTGSTQYGNGGSDGGGGGGPARPRSVRLLGKRRLQGRFWEELGDTAAAAVERSEMPPQALCNTLWAFATVDCRHAALLRAAAECIAEGRRSRFEPVGITNLCWSFATLRFYNCATSLHQDVRQDKIQDEHEDLDFSLSLDSLDANEEDHSHKQEQQHQFQHDYWDMTHDMYDNTENNDLYGRLYGKLAGLALGCVDRMSLPQLSKTAWALVTARQHLPSGSRQPQQELRRPGCPRPMQHLPQPQEMQQQRHGGHNQRPQQQQRQHPLEKRQQRRQEHGRVPRVQQPQREQQDQAQQDPQPLPHLAVRQLLSAIRVRATRVFKAEVPATTTATATVAEAAARPAALHDPHATSVLAWALSTAAPPGDPRCTAFLEAAVAAAVAAPEGLMSYSDQDLAMLLTAHLRVGSYSPPLMIAVREALIRRASSMGPKALTDICYSLAVKNYYHQEMYDAIAAAVADRLDGFGPALASRVVWSLARARHYNARLLDSFADYIRPHLPRCSPLDLTSCSAALAHLHHYHPRFFADMAREVLNRISAAGPTSSTAATTTTSSPTASVTASAATASTFPSASGCSVRPELPQPQPQLPQQLNEHLHPQPPQQHLPQQQHPQSPPQPLPERSVVQLLWCFALLGHVDEGLLEGLAGRLRGVDVERLGVPAVMQLFQAQTLLQDLYRGVIAPPQVLSQAQMQAARLVWQRVAQAAVSPSRLQAEVVACLRRLGCQPRCERTTLDGLFSIDTSLVWEGRRVAVEVDGPTHFTCSQPYRPLGRTLARRRCLEIRGWRVVSVAGHEWRALGGDAAREEAYMSAALEGALWRTHVLEGLSGLGRGRQGGGR
ncbi:hypothetical protein Agub_g13020, partial [Astrephomene gubernaculifera]